MCGIAGFFDAYSDTDRFDDLVAQMISMIEHRGPDELGISLDDSMAMGAARLSVIDLGNGQQPMRDQTDRYHICCNGELYNYIELRDDLIQSGINFKTQSDTEVVLQAYIAWGVSAFHRFNGGYAFAIYDRIEKTLVLCRDKFGKRPLYYTRIGKGLAFASEQKCFLPLNKVSFSFSTSALSDIFSIWTPLPDQSPFEDISQVPPGSYMTIDYAGRVNVRNYYSLPTQSEVIDDEGEAIESVQNVLTDAVSIRLRSDVEVGTYLSGGLDSSITSLLTSQQISRKLKTFSIQFDTAEFDESNAQNIMSEFIDSEHLALKISDKDIVENFANACYHAEVPVF